MPISDIKKEKQVFHLEIPNERSEPIFSGIVIHTPSEPITFYYDFYYSRIITKSEAKDEGYIESPDSSSYNHHLERKLYKSEDDKAYVFMNLYNINKENALQIFNSNKDTFKNEKLFFTKISEHIKMNE